MQVRSRGFVEFLTQRRSVRYTCSISLRLAVLSSPTRTELINSFSGSLLSFFSTEHVPLQVVRDCVRAAGTAPSGAHCQPWTFMIVANEGVKQQIRELVEREEQVNYDRRMKREWVSDVSNLVSNLHGPKDEVRVSSAASHTVYLATSPCKPWYGFVSSLVSTRAPPT